MAFLRIAAGGCPALSIALQERLLPGVVPSQRSLRPRPDHAVPRHQPTPSTGIAHRAGQEDGCAAGERWLSVMCATSLRVAGVAAERGA